MSQSQVTWLHKRFPVLLVVAISSPAVAQELHSCRYSMADGAVKICFPASPIEAYYNNADGAKADQASCNLCNGQLAIRKVPNTPDVTWNRRSLVDVLLRTQKERFAGSKVLFLRQSHYAGHPSAEIGYTFEVEGETLYCRERVVGTETDLVRVSLLSSLADPIGPWVGDQFFDSLELALPVKKFTHSTR